MDEREQEKAALAWMRAQAKIFDSSITDDTGAFWCARVLERNLSYRYQLTRRSTLNKKVGGNRSKFNWLRRFFVK